MTSDEGTPVDPTHTDGPSTSPESDRKAEPDREPPASAPRQPEPVAGSSPWLKRLVWTLVAIALAFVAYQVAASYFPRWWAQRVADQVRGDFSRGTLWGLFYGFMFSFIPLLVILQVRRKFLNWTWRLVVLVVGLALAAPNWLTLSVVVGRNNAAHAGERIMDVEAPGFRSATAIGVGIGVALALVVVATSLRLARRKKQVAQLKAERDELKRSLSDPTPENTDPS